MIRKRIVQLYGNPDNMIRVTGTFISRSYLYNIINGYSNISLKVMLELKKILQLDTIDELLVMLNYDKK